MNYLKKKEDILAQLRGGLIVSCQALENEPLHSPAIMAKMALAAKQVARLSTLPGSRIVAEGGINEPNQLARAFRKGAFTAVVGGSHNPTCGNY